MTDSLTSHDENAVGQRKTARRSLIILLLFLPLLCMGLFCVSQFAILITNPGIIGERIAAIATADFSPWQVERFEPLDPRIEDAIRADTRPNSTPNQVSVNTSPANPDAQEIVIVALAGNQDEENTESDLTEPIVAVSGTLSATSIATDTLTTTPTSTVTGTLSPTPTGTLSATPTATSTLTQTATATSSLTPTATSTLTLTPTATSTLTPTPTNTLTLTPTPTATSTLTVTPSPTATNVIPPPSANFSINIIGQSVSFTNLSTGSFSNVSWSFGDGSGSSTSNNPVYTYSSGGTYTVVLTVSGVGGSDSASFPVTIATVGTDLSFTINTSNSNPQAGQTLTVTATINNTSSTPASGITSQISFGSGLSFQSATGTGTFNGSTWSVGSLGAGGSATLTMTIRANTSGVSAPVSINLSSVSPTDTNGGNNTASVTINVQAAPPPPTDADISLSLTASPTADVTGNNVTYTLTVTNNGVVDATGVAITQTLPTGISFVSSGACSAVGQTITCPIGALTNGNSTSASVIAQVNQSGALTSSATVSANQPDPVTANNSASASVNFSNSVDLSLNMTASSTTPPEGSTLTYSILLTNNSGISATNISADVTLPSGVTYVLSSATGGTFNVGTRRWTVSSLNAGDSISLNLTVTVNTGTNATNQVANVDVTSFDQTDPSPASASVTITPSIASAVINLNVALSGSTGTVNFNDTLTYTATVTNQGIAPATNVQAQVNLAPNTSPVTSPSGNGSYDTATQAWTIGSLSPGQSVSRTFRYTVPQSIVGQNSTLSVSMSSYDQSDSNLANNSASQTVSAYNRGLYITNQVNDNTPNMLQEIRYTIRLRNADAIQYTGVQVTDLLPSGLTYTRSNVPVGTYNPTTGIWDIGTLASGGDISIQIFGTVNPGTATTTITNTASITASNEVDPDTSDNSASRNVTVNANRGLALSMGVNDGTPRVEQQIRYQITLRNNDIVDYTGVQITDILPVGLTYDSFTSDQGTYDPITGIWDVGNIVIGDTLTLRIFATTDPNTGGTSITNTATITASDQTDPDTSNNSASRTINVDPRGLDLDKSVNNSSPIEGDTVVYDLFLRNFDAIQYDNIQIEDILPAGVTYISHTANVGSYDPITGIWAIPTMASGANEHLYITVRVDTGTAGTTIRNETTIIASTPVNPPTGDNTGAVDISPQVSNVDITLDLDDAATPDPGVYNENDLITLEFVLSNTGTDNATGVSVELTLPTSVTYVSTGSLDSGTYDSSTGIWTVGNVNSGQTLRGYVTVQVNTGTAGSTISITADVLTVDQPETDITNNDGSESFTILGTDLGITQSVSDTTPFEEQTITYTLIVTNIGRDTTDVRVTDNLPTGVTYISDTTLTGTYDNVSGVWSVGDMLNGASAQLDIVVQVQSGTAGGTITNTSFISNFTQQDTNLGNNSASTNIDPQPVIADLTLSKSTTVTNMLIGTSFDYVISYTNNGPSPATNVVITDMLPPEVSFASSASCTHSAGVVTCNIGTVASGASSSVTISVTATGEADPITNSATISATEADADTSNNSASVDIAIGPQPITASSLCSPEPTSSQRWQVTNPNASSITFTWLIAGTGATASETVTGSSSLIFTTPTQTASDTLEVYINGILSDSVITTNQTCDVDLGIGITVDNTTPYTTQTVQYTVTLSNNGAFDVSNIVIDNIFATNATLVGATPTSGTWDGISQWSVPSLASSTSTTLTIDVQLTGNNGDARTHTTSITGANQPDANTTDNSASVTATITPITADLQISALAFDPTPILDGGTSTIDITISNPSGSNVPSVNVSNILSPELSFVSVDTATQGTFDAGSNTWTVGTLGAGATANLRVTVSDNTANGTVSITPTIGSITVSDPNTANNSATATLTINPPTTDVTITLVSATPDTILSGESSTLFVSVTNNGPETATNTQITVTIPPYLTFVSDTCASSSQTVNTLTCTVGTLANGVTTSAEIVVNSTGTGATPIDVTVSISETDPNTSNNTSTIALTVN